MQQKKKNRFDSFGIGLLAGAILPITIFFIVYLTKNTGVSFYKYIDGMWQMQALLKLASLCVFANVAVFWIFLKLKYERAARGVLGATILYALVVLITRAI